MKRLSLLFVLCLMVVFAANADTYVVNGVVSDTPAIDVFNNYIAPNTGPVTDDDVFIDFDDLDAPSLFNDQVPLTTEYEDLGVVFQGLGEVLNDGGGFSVSGYSAPNFLAFNTGVGANPPETLLFDPPITEISILGGHSSSVFIEMTAYNSGGGQVGYSSVTGTTAMQELSITGNDIVEVVLDFSGSVCCFDDLFFVNGPGDPVTLTLNPTQTTVPQTGGNVVYDVSLVSTIPAQMTGLRYQTFATLPNSVVYGPIDNIPFTLTPFMDVTIYNMTVTVPGGAPTGSYMFEAIAGVPNNPNLQVTDSFPFVKVGAGLAEEFNSDPGASWNWICDDLQFSGGYAKMDGTGGSWQTGAYEAMEFDNFTLTSSFQIQDASSSSRGVMWCTNGPRDADFNGYGLYVSSTSYSVWKYTAGSASAVISWATGTGINTGMGAVNSMEVQGMGGTYDLYINGTYHNSFTDATYPQGYVGVIEAYNVTWYDNVYCSFGTVDMVPGAPAAQGTPVEGYFDDAHNPIDAPMPVADGVMVFDRYSPSDVEFIPEDWASSGFSLASNEGTVTVPTEFALETAYPNPFNPTTSFAVSLPQTSDLTVSVYNVTGQLVATVASGDFSAGRHTMTFDASSLASGLYFIRATVPGQMDQTQKVMLVR
ncbi:T9SS type A sorting domain-containing protein [bacterium]|nr:T9SS type A sorting domain-containing protein [bacterium]